MTVADPGDTGDAADAAASVPPVGVLAVVRFVSELVLLGGLAFVGWQLGTTTLVSLSLAVLLLAA